MSYTLGIHAEGEEWKVALLRLFEGKPQIVCLKTFDLKEHPIEELKTVLHKKHCRLATALKPEDFVLRKLELEIKGYKNVLAALPFQAEDLIPFPKEQTLAIPFLEDAEKGGSAVRLIATKKDLLEDHLHKMNQSGIDPSFVTTDVHALKRWIHFVQPQIITAFILYAHKEMGFAAFLENGQIVEFKTLDCNRAGQWKRLKNYFLTLAENAETFPWVAIGDPALLKEYDLEAPKTDPSLLEYALPIGIALDAAHDDKNSVQFRSGDLLPEKDKKKQKKLLFLSLACLLFSLLVFGPLGFHWLERHESQMVRRAQTALQKLGAPSSEEGIENLLETLEVKGAELEREKKFGPHFPIVTWLLNQITLASQSIETPNLPKLLSLQYHVDVQGVPQLQIEWSCSNKETLKTIKKQLQALGTVRIVKWKEESKSHSITLQKL
jgi:hypothetical protein